MRPSGRIWTVSFSSWLKKNRNSIVSPGTKWYALVSTWRGRLFCAAHSAEEQKIIHKMLRFIFLLAGMRTALSVPYGGESSDEPIIPSGLVACISRHGLKKFTSIGMTLAFTGATGFIGSYLARWFNRKRIGSIQVLVRSASAGLRSVEPDMK